MEGTNKSLSFLLALYCSIIKLITLLACQFSFSPMIVPVLVLPALGEVTHVAGMFSYGREGST